MVGRAIRTITGAYRRYRRESTLMGSASRMELDARVLRDATSPFSPARLAVTVADVALTCGHLADAATAWTSWLPRHDEAQPTTSTEALARARQGLTAIAEDLRRTQTEAGETSEALRVLSRHDAPRERS